MPKIYENLNLLSRTFLKLKCNFIIENALEIAETYIFLKILYLFNSLESDSNQLIPIIKIIPQYLQSSCEKQMGIRGN